MGGDKNPEIAPAGEADRIELRLEERLEKNFMKLFRSMTVMFLAAVSLAFAPSLLAAAKKANGADVFRQKCSMCHGINGKGYAAIKTPDFTDPKWQAAHPEKERKDAIENGVKGTAMVSFKDKLSQQEITAVLKYIRSLGTGKKK